MVLRDVISRNGLMQRDIAAAVGVAPETFSRWVSGRVTPGGENLVRLLDFLRKVEPGLQAEDILAVDKETSEPGADA